MNPKSLELECLSLQSPAHMGFQRPLLHHHGRSCNAPEHSTGPQCTQPDHRIQVRDALGQLAS